ncbi:DUF711 family protein [Gammaproteobacteria bacterium]|nr:DUF711 family protein [Gammaproteobacteria bacterium]
MNKIHKIRAITIGVNSPKGTSQNLETLLKFFVKERDQLLKKERVQLRTSRITLSPLNITHPVNDASIQSTATWLTKISNILGIRWFCIPFNFVEQDFEQTMVNPIANLVKKFPNSFVNLIIADDKTINVNSVNSSAQLIKNLSINTNNGFDNFRVGVSSNCNPYTPFFPFSYHQDQDGFSLALEVLELFHRILLDEKNIQTNKLRLKFIDALSSELFFMQEFGNELEERTGLKFYGIDSSLAPFPDGSDSVALLMESLGLDSFGSSGTLFFTSFMTNIINSAFEKSQAQKVGFNGVMYSVLEDDYLALAVKNKKLSIDSLLLYSTVCGCGIDMVPVPGNIFLEEISSLILDTAALSIALKKPLGTRILPIPGKNANELTDFNYDFLVDTRVMEIKNQAIYLRNLPTKISNLGKP